eukprot:284817977_2
MPHKESSSSATSGSCLTGDKPLASNHRCSWNHVAVVRHLARLRLYINGKQPLPKEPIIRHPRLYHENYGNRQVQNAILCGRSSLDRSLRHAVCALIGCAILTLDSWMSSETLKFRLLTRIYAIPIGRDQIQAEAAAALIGDVHVQLRQSQELSPLLCFYLALTARDCKQKKVVQKTFTCARDSCSWVGCAGNKTDIVGGYNILKRMGLLAATPSLQHVFTGEKSAQELEFEGNWFMHIELLAGAAEKRQEPKLGIGTCCKDAVIGIHYICFDGRKRIARNRFPRSALQHLACAATYIFSRAECRFFPNPTAKQPRHVLLLPRKWIPYRSSCQPSGSIYCYFASREFGQYEFIRFSPASAVLKYLRIKRKPFSKNIKGMLNLSWSAFADSGFDEIFSLPRKPIRLVERSMSTNNHCITFPQEDDGFQTRFASWVFVEQGLTMFRLFLNFLVYPPESQPRKTIVIQQNTPAKMRNGYTVSCSQRRITLIHLCLFVEASNAFFRFPLQSCRLEEPHFAIYQHWQTAHQCDQTAADSNDNSHLTRNIDNSGPATCRVLRAINKSITRIIAIEHIRFLLSLLRKIAELILRGGYRSFRSGISYCISKRLDRCRHFYCAATGGLICSRRCWSTIRQQD